MSKQKEGEKKGEDKKKAAPSPDAVFGYDEALIELLDKEKPWVKDVKFFKKCRISALASMKMLKHSLAGVEKGQKATGMSVEVMGLMIGKPEGDTIVVLDVSPLPVEGENNFVEAQSKVQVYMTEMLDSMEKRRKEGFIGWYHSHPFDVETYSNCHLSQTDVSTQTVFQLSSPCWLSVVVDPLRSIAKQTPDFGAFRTFPPSFDSPATRAPDGSAVIDKDATIARWGHAYNRYYTLQVEYFMSSLGSRMLEIMSRNNLWIRVLSSSSIMEAENRKGFAQRVRKAVDKLQQAEQKGGMGFGRRGGGRGNNFTQATQACCELAIEQCQGHSSQVSKMLLFNEFESIGQPREEKESKGGGQ